MLNSTQKLIKGTFKLSLIFIFFVSISNIGFSQCGLNFRNITNPSSCYAHDGSFEVFATGQTGNPCQRRIQIYVNDVLLVEGLEALTVSGLSSRDYKVVALNDCNCPVVEGKIISLSGGSPTKLTPHVNLGFGSYQSNNVDVCRGANLNLGVQSLGIKNLLITGPNDYEDNTPNGSSFWTLNNVQPAQSGLYTIKYTNNKGCISYTNIMLNVGEITVNAGPDKVGCIGTEHIIQTTVTGQSVCKETCPETLDSLLVNWTLDQCDASNQTNQSDYSEFTPVYPSLGNCTNVSATNIFRLFGEHSCTPVNGSYPGDVGICVPAMNSCDPAEYNSDNAIRFEVTLTPAEAGRITGLSFNEQSPFEWMTTNGSKGKNNFNTKYLIRVYKNDLLIFSQDDLLTERTWNIESFDFSSDPDFAITEPAVFRFELRGYCVTNVGGNMSGWEIDNIKLFGGCCSGLASNNDFTYLWSTGDTTSNLVVNPSSTTSYSVTVTDCKGCQHADTVLVQVNTLPTASINGLLSVCTGGSSVLTASGGTSYLWSTGETTTSITVTPSETTTYSVTVTDINGCQSSTSATVTVNPLPSPVISGDLEICLGESTVLTASGGMEYEWSTGETTESITVTPIVNTTYMVMAKDTNGCQEYTTVIVVVRPLPVAEINGDLVICYSDSTTLTASGGSSYLWSNGMTSASITVSPLGNTNYSVTVSNSFGCTDVTNVSVTVNPLPIAIITGNNSFCVGKSSLLTASGGVSYEWSTGAITASIMVNPSLNTTYTVTVTDINGCTATASRMASVMSLPEANITGENKICEGSSVLLTATGGVQYLWSTSETTNTINVTPTTTTTYKVTVTDTNGCTGTSAFAVVVNPNPELEVTGGDEFCIGGSATLTANVSGTTICQEDCIDELLIFWDFDACNANGANEQNSYDEFVPTIVSNGGLLSVSASGISRGRGDHSCTPDGNGGAGICFGVLEGCDPNDYNPINGLKFSVVINPNENGSLTKLTFREQSPLIWVTTNGSSGINDYNTKYLIRVYKNGELVYSQNELLTEREWNVETFDFSDHAEFNNLTEETTFTFELYGYCIVDRGGNMPGWELDDIRIFGGECPSSPTSAYATYLWSNGSTTSQIIVTPTETTTYTVTVTDCNGCFAIDSAVVIINPLPVVTISGINEICVGESTTLIASGGSSYEWSNGATTESITVNPITTTTYSVTVTDGENCSSSASVTVTVNPLPVVIITGDNEICVGESTTLTASGGTSYVWSNGATTASITVNPTTTTTYSVTVTDSENCSSSASITVTVNPLPIVIITGINEICVGESTTLTASGGTSYVWSNGATTASITVNPTTTTTYSVTVTNSENCSSSAGVTVTVNPLPVVIITGINEICVGESTTLTASGGTSYIWSNGATTASITVNPTTTTTYSVTVTDSENCSSSASVTVTVNPLPVVIITGDNEICVGESTTLAASGGTSYVWSNGATTPSITVNPTTTTTYNVTVTDSENCSSSASVTVTVNPLPVVIITGINEICVGESTTLAASGGTSYVWSNGATTPSITVNPTTTTTYSVTVTDGENCTASASITVTVNPLPVVIITGDNEICVGESTTLTASGGTSYVWSNGATTASITVNPTTTTTYSVTVTDSENCSSSASVTVTVNPLPVVIITGINEICVGESTTLAASGGSSYEWSNGATTESITVNPTTTTTYSVTVTDGENCTASASITVTVNPLPVVTITGDNEICVGESTTLTSSGGTSYVWSNGATTASITVNPTTTTTYSVTVTDGENCSSSASVTVTVNPLPVVIIIGDNEICVGDGTTLTASGGSSYEWSNGATTASITVNPVTTTTYSVTVTDNKGCSAIANVTVIVNPLPIAVITGDLEICLGETTTLYASGGQSYLWSTGATTYWIDVNPVVTTVYSVTVTDINGCKASTSVTVTVNPLPVVIITGDNEICVGESTTLIASGGTSYIWSNGATTASITVNPTTTTTYSVTVTDSENCSSSASITVTVNPLPVVIITGDNEICVGDSTTLTASGGSSYEWSNGANTASITVNPVTTTTYSVTVTDNKGCSAIANTTVIVNPLPIAVITGDLEICLGETTTLYASGGQSYLWNTGATTYWIDVNPVVTTVYSVTVTDINGCKASTSVTVTVNPLPVVIITGDNEICVGESTTLIASGGTSYIWSNGSTTASITVNPSTTTTYNVTVTDSENCSSSASITVTVNPLPVVIIIGDNEICVGDGTTLTASGGSSYEWSNGANTASITVNPVTTTTYSVTVTDNKGCSAIANVTVIVNPLPIAVITGDLEICLGETTTLYASGGQSYLWNTGATTYWIDVNPVVTTVYSVTVTDINGCKASTSVTVTVNPLPVVIITGDNEICVGESTTLIASGGTSYIWSNGSTTASITVNPSTTTTYNVTVTDSENCSSSASVTVTVNPLPVVIITGDNEICVGDSTTLTASGGSSYEWSNGETAASITVNPSTTTTYSVTVTDSENCSSSASVTVTVNPLPVVTITGNTEICVGECTELTASGGLSYEWLGLGENGYKCDGAFYIGGPQGGGIQSLYTIKSDFTLNEVGSLGTNNINGIGYYCEGGNRPYIYAMKTVGTSITDALRANFVRINPKSLAIDILGEMPQPPNPYGFAGTTGIMSFIADVSKEGVYYFPAVAALINPVTLDVLDYTIYLGKIDVNNHGNGSNVTYTLINVQASCQTYIDAWLASFQAFATNPSSGISGGIQDWALNPEGNTLYSFLGIENGLFSLNLNTNIVSCVAGPIGNSIYTGQTGVQTDEFGGLYFSQGTLFGTQVDRGRLFSINTTSGALTLVSENLPKDFSGDNASCYDCGNTNTGGATSPTIVVCPEETTSYIVEVTDEKGCINFDTIIVTVNPLPIVTITGDKEICLGESTTLTASGGSTYLWSNGSTSTSITVNPSSTTTYSVTVSDGNGCEATNSVTVIVNPLPTPIIVGDKEICVGESTNLGVFGGSIYLWSNGSTSAAINVSPVVTTTYSVTVTDNKGCSAIANVTVIVNPLPIAVITGDLEICLGETTTLYASGGQSYLWSTGATTYWIDVNPVVTTVYSVIVTDLNGCKASTSVTVTVNPLPVVIITGNNEICVGESTTLAASGGTSYVWNNGATTPSITVNPTTTTTYSVTVTDSENCSSSASVTVTVNPLPVVTITGDNEICVGESTTLTASGGTSYIWSNGSTTASITVNPTTTTTYNITVTDSENCSASSSVTVTVNPLPVVIITGDNEICVGESTTLTASGGSSYLWSNGATTASISVNPTTTTTYSVTVTNSENCTASSSITVTVNPLPVVIITGDNEICVGESTTLTASGGTSYVWSNGATTASITVNPTTTTTYSVTVTDSENCSSSASVTVTVNPLPVVIITGDNEICVGESTTLTASGGSSFLWSNGASTPSITVNPTTTTTYSVTVTDGENCSSSASVTVTVNPLPVVIITGDNEICVGESTKLTASGGSSYEWSNGATTTSITVNPTTTTTYSVTVTDSENCSASASVTVTVNPLPVVIITGDNEICVGESTTITASGGSSYLWSNGATTASISVNPTTTTTYSVTVTNSENCTASSSITVTVNPLPVVIITGDNEICVGESTTLTASGGTSYVWSNGATTASITVNPTTTTTYSITVTDSENCSSSASVTVTVNPLPVVIITGDNEICLGESTTLTSSGGSSYVWSNGATTSSITVNPTTTTTYSVIVTNSENCTASSSITVTVNPLPVVIITGDNEICVGDSTTLTASGGTSYVWSNGATTASITVNPTTTTTYSVTVTDGENCTASASVTVTVNPLPVVIITGDNEICIGKSSTLTASGGSSYLWSNGATTASITVNPTTTTTYSVTVTDGENCSSSASVTVTVNPLPVVIITGDNEICVGESTTLTASGGTSYTWSNGATTASITVNPTTTTTYSVTVTNSENCTASSSITVTINPLPVVIITGDNEICVGESTTLTASGGTSYVWSNGATTTSITVNPTTTTTYSVTVTDSENCSSSASITVTVNPLPVVIITGDNEICVGESTTLTASGGTSYVWSNGAITASITVNPTTTTTYSVTVTDGENCSSSASVTVTVNPLPVVVITGDNEICVGESTTLTASGGTSYVWNNGAITASITVNPTTTTTYSVTVTDSENCSSSASVTVTVNPLPVVIITGDNEICLGESTTLTASGGSSYVWSNGATTSSITVNPTTTTTYSVTVTDSENCSSSASVTVTVNPLPVVIITGDNEICVGESTTLTASGGSSFLWSNGATTPSITVNPTTTTTYSVTVTDGENCTASASITVIVNPLPVVIITGDNEICVGENTTLTASGGTSYTWSNGATTASITVNPTTTTTYSVTVTDGENCTASASVTVTVNPLPVVIITGDNEICIGESTTLTASGGTSYTWSNGAITASITVNPTTTTTYSVTVTDGENCTSSASITVIVNPLPVVIITGDNEICVGESTTLTASGGSSYVWSNGATTSSITVNPTTTTTYSVTVTDGENCTASASVTVTVNPLPVVIITGDNEICVGESTTLAASGGTSYVWSNGATTASITVNPTTTTTYSITVTDGENCTASASITVTVNPLPVVIITGDNEICVGESTTLTASGGTSYTWSNGATTPSITVNPTTTTIYSVTVTDGENCTASASITVIVNPLPIVTIVGDHEICLGESTTLTASGGSSYLWSNGATTASITVNPISTTTYSVTVTDGEGCNASTSIIVKVNPNPVASISGDTLICEGDSTILTATGGGTYLWSTGQTTATIIVSPIVSTTYSVTVTNGFGCTDATSVVVTTNVKPDIVITGIDKICKGDSSILVATAYSNVDCPGVCVLDSAQVLAYWSLDSCASVMSLGTHMDYSEFTPIVTNPNCTSVAAGNVHRINGNKHSCTPGPESVGMCIGSQKTCNPAKLDYSQSLRFEVELTPSQGGKITGLQFYEQSPEVYQWVNGPSGPNNYATKYVLKVSKNGDVIYYNDQLNTNRTWGLVEFDFSDNPNFATLVTAKYLFELVPYCTINNGAIESVWDIDEIKVLGGCCVATANEITSYVWSNGETGPSITVKPTETTTYTVTVTDCNGCINVEEYEVVVSCLMADLGADMMINLGETVVLTPIITGKSICSEDNDSLNTIKYLWSTGETTPSITVKPSSSIFYRVTVTDCNECRDTESLSIHVMMASPIMTFPNPATERVNITSETPFDENMSIRILSLNNQVMYDSGLEMVKNTPTNATLVFPTNMPNGVYILEIKNGERTHTQRIIVLK